MFNLKLQWSFQTTFFAIFIFGITLFGCKQPKVDQQAEIPKVDTNQPGPSATIPNKDFPDWAISANMYEVNLRQYTPEGTIDAFMKHLPRLKEMGVDVLWFMPMHPISKLKRKEGLGSYYSVADYKDINPEFGTLADFKKMVNKIHEMDMYIIIDWVPNHTGWDHAWITEHPDWYTQDKDGNIIDPIDPETGESWGWTDVADLNYDKKEMRAEMIKDMSFWLTDCNIDGFRCDVAHSVPNDFWIEANSALKKQKTILLLAESDKPENLNTGGFHLDYGWPFHHLMNDIAKGEKNATAIDEYLIEDAARIKKGFHLHFTSNHDENTWAGTVFDRMGDAHKVLAVLASTFDGMPLIYSGQESLNKRQLKFFVKDQIDWADFGYADFYKRLLALKHNNKALWNGKYGGSLNRLSTNNDNIFAFTREKDGDKVLVVLNLNKEKQAIKLSGENYIGDYKNVFDKSSTKVTADMEMNLDAWDYLVLSNK